jgi:hypothetical protein
MLPDVLVNYFDYAVPDQIIPLNVGEGDNENLTSDSEGSFHGFDFQSDEQSENDVNNDSYDELPTNAYLHVDSVIHNKQPNDNVHAPGAGELTKSVKFTNPISPNVLPDNCLIPKCSPNSGKMMGPSTTRSRRPYQTVSPSTHVPPSLPSASPTLLGRTGKMQASRQPPVVRNKKKKRKSVDLLL